MGNGEFRFDSRVPNQSLTLVRNDQYAGTAKPQVERLEFRVYSELQTSYDDVISGNLDHVRAIPAAALAGGRWRADLRRGRPPEGGPGHRLARRPDLRPALRQPAAAPGDLDGHRPPDDRQAIFGGTYTPATGYATSAAAGYVPGQCGQSCTYDPQAARQLLAQAGGFPGTATLTANSDGGHDQYMQAVADQIRQTLGIDCATRPCPRSPSSAGSPTPSSSPACSAPAGRATTRTSRRS